MIRIYFRPVPLSEADGRRMIQRLRRHRVFGLTGALLLLAASACGGQTQKSTVSGSPPDNAVAGSASATALKQGDFVGSPPAVAELAGAAALKRGDFATALRELQPLADQGIAPAQFALGIMY